MDLKATEQAVDLMTRRIGEALRDEKQFYRYVQGKEGEEVVLGKADTRAIKEMSGALKELTQLLCDLSDREQARQAASEQTGVVLLPPAQDGE